MSSYPGRAKVSNAKANPDLSILVMGEELNSAWARIDALVEHFRSIRGEHPDWDEYRQAMADQGNSAITITPTRRAPVSKGGFPPELFED